MHDLAAFATMVAGMLVWRYGSDPNLYIYTYIHHLGWGISLSLRSRAFTLVYIAMAASMFILEAVKVCPQDHRSIACTETVLVGVTYISLLIGFQCSSTLRAGFYPLTNNH